MSAIPRGNNIATQRDFAVRSVIDRTVYIELDGKGDLPMDFTVHGPFELRRLPYGMIDSGKEAKRAFWTNVCNEDRSLPSACGCYLYAIQAGKGITPWYVGMANRQSFQKECFASHKIVIYSQVAASGKGTPVLFLLAKRTHGRRAVRPSAKGHADICFLETFLIASAIAKNPRLKNVQMTKMLRNTKVPGLLNSPIGQPSASVAQLKRALFRVKNSSNSRCT